MKYLLILIIIISTFSLKAQDDIVHDNLRMLAHGKVIEVKAKIPDLLAKYPDHPGVKLLHGAILDDGSVAVKIYEKIISEYPDSQWADDAYWRMVQYYAISGDIDKAKRSLDIFRRRYPASPYVAPASDVVQTVEKMTKSGETRFAEKVTTLQKVDPNEQTKDYARPVEDIEPVSEDDVIEKQTKTAEERIEDQEPLVDSGDLEESDVLMNSDDYDGHYGLQVAIYRDKESAEMEKEKFLKQRLRTSVVEKDVDGEMMYAVVIGHYSSLQSAEAAKIIVKRQCGCDPIIYQKGNIN
jgi:hypothetical protein